LTKPLRGDTIQVTVHNQITGPEEGTALHWHGILQKTSQYVIMDLVSKTEETKVLLGGWTVFPVSSNARSPQEKVSPILSSLIFTEPRGTILITQLSMPEVLLAL
jgi:hypothetical protein